VPTRQGQVARWRLLAATLAATAACLAGFTFAGTEDDAQTYEGTIDPAVAQGASAELEVTDDGVILVAEGLPQPEGADVYKAWVKPPGVDAPEPSVVFLPRDGAATVAIPADGDVEAVLVTREPGDGSEAPSEDPVITIPMT
jgi:hypothetical protein